MSTTRVVHGRMFARRGALRGRSLGVPAPMLVAMPICGRSRPDSLHRGRTKTMVRRVDAEHHKNDTVAFLRQASVSELFFIRVYSRLAGAWRRGAPRAQCVASAAWVGPTAAREIACTTMSALHIAGMRSCVNASMPLPLCWCLRSFPFGGAPRRFDRCGTPECVCACLRTCVLGYLHVHGLASGSARG